MGVKISTIALKITPDGTEEIEVNDGGTTKKLTAQSIADLGGGGGGAITDGSGTTANGTAVDLGGAISSDVVIADNIVGGHIITIGADSGGETNRVPEFFLYGGFATKSSVYISDDIALTSFGVVDITASDATLNGDSIATVPFVTSGLAGKQNSLGFTAENVANKATDFTTVDNTKYPTTQATLNEILARVAGLAWKAPVTCATTANITLSGEQTIDGVATSSSRVLVKNQSTASQNGIYMSASGAWARTTDADVGTELHGAVTTVQEGTANANTTWVQTADGITLGSTSISWSQLGTSVPDANSTTKGIARLYPSTSLGTNTDGAPDQNAVKSYVDTGLGLKQNLLSYTPMDPAQNGQDFASPAAALINIGGQQKKVLFNVQTGSTYTPQLSDYNDYTEILMVNGSATTFTIPNDATVNFPVGAKIWGRSIGNVTTFSNGAGVTTTSTSTGMVSGADLVLWGLTKTAANTWYLDNGTIVNVANNQLSNMANATIKGRYTSGTGAPEDLTQAQAVEILFDVSNYYRLYSDFTGGSSEFSTSVSGTGAVVSFTADGGDSKHPGILQLSCGTTTTGFASIRNGASSTITPADGKIIFDAWIKIATVSDGTDTFTLRVGFGTAVNADGSDAAFFRYTHGTNGGRWQTVTRHSSSETAKDAGGSTVAAATYYHLKITTDTSNSTYSFYINGTLVATPHTSDLPTSQVTVIGSITKSAGTTNRTLSIDACQIIQFFNTAR